MKIVIDIPEILGRKIGEILEKGLYPDLSTFFLISAENQLLLERSEEGILSFSKMESLYNTAKSNRKRKSRKIDEIRPRINLKVDNLDFGLLEGLALGQPHFEQVNWSGAEKEDDLWLWGQYNRIFPVKVAVRLMGVAQNKARSLIAFPAWKKEAASFARELGMRMLKHDDILGRRRDEKLSTAFPIGKEREKALSRFENHFLGNVRGNGYLKLSGALLEMKFANVTIKGEETFTGLTSAGLEFAKLPNNVLDNSDLSAEALSDDEVDFYLNHVTKYLSGERNAISMLMRLIQSGVNTRNELDEAVRKISKDNWSDETCSTMRAGVMSRIFELGLIEKERKGVKVLYHLSDRGRKAFDRFFL